MCFQDTFEDDDDMSGERGCFFRDGKRRIGILSTISCKSIFLQYNYYRALKSHTFGCNLTFSHSHEYFSHISTLLEGNSTVLTIRSAYNCKIPSFTITELGLVLIN